MFTEAEKAELEEMSMVPFESFKEKIVAFGPPTTQYNSTSGDYNFGFGNDQPNQDFSYVQSSGEFWATLTYVNLLTDLEIEIPKNSAPIGISNSHIKVCVTGNDKTFFDNAVKVIVDGDEFRSDSNRRDRGLFKRNYYEYYFRRIS